MKRYCLDSNVLIEPWNKYYSMALCPEYWEVLDELARNGTVFCTEEVRREIEKVDDELSKWVKARPYLFREASAEVQRSLRAILGRFRRLVDTARDRSMADPWVIAHAQVEKAIVVTKEMPTPAGSKRIKIPDVCNQLGVPWMNEFQFLAAAGVRFSARL